MGDLKTFWPDKDLPLSNVGIEGDGVISRGSEPTITVDDPNGLRPIWGNDPVQDPSGQETANSVSGLPLRPNRQESSENPPPPPTLQDRNPGTIDQK